ncbi:MAG TPA: aldehyde dehydrogenase family protein [Steroidobacteraceae bacterium]|jgi:acyl-CoA reductase-like NAD-dependent aldehyde dehydrogenase|nr:aldehyde dehydrogenase family protein [Steroidobacteraceae bacterium]
MATETLKTISPVDGRIYVERPLETAAGIDRALEAAQTAQLAWARLPLAARCQILGKAVDAFVAKAGEIAAEITWQMGRPIAHAPGEIRGFEERARHMLELAPEALASIRPGQKAGFERQIKRVPLGLVVVVAPWNYPYLTAVNAVLPALIAGNAVVLKHSHQTPLCAERFLAAFLGAGVPAGVFQYLHLSHADTARLMGDRRVASVCFTGSVSGGRAVVAATASGFATAGLELGGKDPAYVRADANLAQAIDTLTDGAFFNAGQSCCGIKRIYVAASRHEEFVAGVVDLTRKYRLGSPLDPHTTLGPVVRTAAAEAVRSQVRDAVARGARQLIDEAWFAASVPGTPYLAPQVLVDVDHSMPIMREETFGPAVAIMKVASDEEAVRLMNDSEFGLTAAIFSADAKRAEALGDALETGTVFLNRCDYLDPALAWTGVKNSGRGCTLSRVGFEQLTRPKSYHFRIAP